MNYMKIAVSSEIQNPNWEAPISNSIWTNPKLWHAWFRSVIYISKQWSNVWLNCNYCVCVPFQSDLFTWSRYFHPIYDFVWRWSNQHFCGRISTHVFRTGQTIRLILHEIFMSSNASNRSIRSANHRDVNLHFLRTSVCFPSMVQVSIVRNRSRAIGNNYLAKLYVLFSNTIRQFLQFCNTFFFLATWYH